MRRSLDQSAGLDDLLTERLRHCSLCQGAPPVWMGLWTATASGVGLAITVALCSRCRGESSAWQRVERLMQARYG